MPAKSVTSELRRILNSLPKLSETELILAAERLATLGVELPEGPARRPGITCPITQVSLVTTCNLKKCPYFIENEWSRNCLLEYMDSQGSESLATEEIAFLYGISPKKVEKAVEQGMEALRESSVTTMGFSGDFRRAQPEEIQANLDEGDDAPVTRSTLSPPFMGSINNVLESLIPADKVFSHQAIRILGTLDRIIDEIE